MNIMIAQFENARERSATHSDIDNDYDWLGITMSKAFIDCSYFYLLFFNIKALVTLDVEKTWIIGYSTGWIVELNSWIEICNRWISSSD